MLLLKRFIHDFLKPCTQSRARPPFRHQLILSIYQLSFEMPRMDQSWAPCQLSADVILIYSGIPIELGRFFFFLLQVESTTDKSDKCIEFKLKHGSNRVDLLSESAQKWDQKKLGYPCFCERVIMGYVWVNMGCVRVAYGFPKTWFCHNMGCVRYDYGFARDIYGICTGIYGILRHFLTFFCPKLIEHVICIHLFHFKPTGSTRSQ